MRWSILLMINIVCIHFVNIKGSEFNLTIIHNNDIHSRFLTANNFGEDCESPENVKCFGGIPRIVHKVHELRRQIPHLLYLNAGDNFAGTLWYKVFKWELWAEVVKYMTFDAMSFGNHEFDDGIDGVAEYVKIISGFTKTLACNVDVDNESKLRGLVEKSTVIDIDGRTVGIIGYVLPETAQISNPGPTIEFSNEIECIREEAKKLKEQNVNIIIAVGHSGFKKDKEIAIEVPDVDIVVGGHTNTFLYNGQPPSDEVPSDVYPVVINHEDGRKSLVVQAFAYGKYLGFLNVLFDDNGDITQFSGQPILLDHTIPEDQQIRELLLPKAEIIKQKFNQYVGSTAVMLDGKCRRGECNLGNMVADAMVNYALKHKSSEFSNGWSEYPIAFLPAGSIRASIDETSNGGQILSKDTMRVHPFDNTITAVSVSGAVLKEVFEHCVRRYDPNDDDPEGEFLQVSGIKVKYDVSKPAGQRVVRIRVRCGDCRVPKLEQLDESKIYNVLTTDYIAGGGDLFSMLKDQKRIDFEKLLRDAISEYIETHSPIVTGLERRSKFVTQDFTKTS